MHLNILVIGQSGLGKTTFIKQRFEDYQSTEFLPHDGSSTRMEDFAANPGSLCSHVNESVLTENGEYMVYYHVQDTPGDALACL